MLCLLGFACAESKETCSAGALSCAISKHTSLLQSQFNVKSVDLDDQDEEDMGEEGEDCQTMIERVYETVLCRKVDAGGLKHWMAKCRNGEKEGKIIWKIKNWSQEYKKCAKCKNGCKEPSAAETAADLACKTMIERVYETVLCRKADAGGLKHWMQKCRNGEKEGKIIWKIKNWSQEYKKCAKCKNGCKEPSAAETA